MAVSVRDVAASAGVSVGTVSNVLNRPDRVSPATVERVQQTIARLGFVRNDAARQLRAGRSRTIGLVVLDVRNPFFAEIARGAEQRADEGGLSVLIANSDENSGREERHIDLFDEQRVTGVLLTPVADPPSRLVRMRERGIPTVIVDRQSPDERFASVAVDDVWGGRIAVDHLLGIGRRKVAFVGGPAGLRQVDDRFQGAQEAVARANAELERISTGALTVEEGGRVGAQLMSRRPSDRPDAIFAANDLLAIGILRSLVVVGDVRVPQDIAVVGFDDIDFASSAVVPLTSVRQPAALLGFTAVDLLLNGDDGATTAQSRNVMFRPELVVRASTRG